MFKKFAKKMRKVYLKRIKNITWEEEDNFVDCTLK